MYSLLIIFYFNPRPEPFTIFCCSKYIARIETYVQKYTVLQYLIENLDAGIFSRTTVYSKKSFFVTFKQSIRQFAKCVYYTSMGFVKSIFFHGAKMPQLFLFLQFH